MSFSFPFTSICKEATACVRNAPCSVSRLPVLLKGLAKIQKKTNTIYSVRHTKHEIYMNEKHGDRSYILIIYKVCNAMRRHVRHIVLRIPSSQNKCSATSLWVYLHPPIYKKKTYPGAPCWAVPGISLFVLRHSAAGYLIMAFVRIRCFPDAVCARSRLHATSLFRALP